MNFYGLLCEWSIGTKLSSWTHEKEVRLIFENTGLFEIDYKAVTAIYFGCRMPDSDIDYIMKKLKGRGLKYFKMVNVNNSYRFEAKEIEDKFLMLPSMWQIVFPMILIIYYFVGA